MSKKYVIAKTGEEVKVGDTVVYEAERKTSFGTLTVYQEFTVSPVNIGTLIKNGIIKCVEQNNSSKKHMDLGYYIKVIALQMGCSSEKVIEMLEKLNKLCPKAVLDILVQVVSTQFYKDDPRAFGDAECYYGFRVKDGSIGVVNSVGPHISMFKSKEDAETAKEILKEQFAFMYGKQKNH